MFLAPTRLVRRQSAGNPDRDSIVRFQRLSRISRTPEIFHCAADVVGDNLLLAREAAKSHTRVIVMAGVHFIAETAKLLNPLKTVLIPDADAGCLLAESIDADDIRLLRERYPGVPVVTYVNTSAEVKAASDICCTSAKVVKVVESLGAPRVIMTPDEFLAKNVAAQIKVEIVAWRGAARCMSSSPPPTSANCARPIRGRSCSPIPNARRKWWPRPRDGRVGVRVGQRRGRHGERRRARLLQAPACG